MAKTKQNKVVEEVVKAGQPAPAAEKVVLCPNCAEKDPPQKSTMSPRGTESLSCGTCNCWVLKSQLVSETKDEKIARLKAELKAAESE